MLKICSKCGAEKDAETEFGKRSRSRDGYHPRCKKCLKISRDEPDAKMKLKKRNIKNRDKILKLRKEYYHSNGGKEKHIAWAHSKNGLICVKRYCSSIGGRYERLRTKARRRGIEFMLTLEEFSDMMENEKKCFYCETEVSCAIKRSEIIDKYDGDDRNMLAARGSIGLVGRRAKVLTVDRMDSTIGYTRENCVMCCSICNSTKGFLIPSDLYKSIAPGIVANIVRICEEAGLVI